jgi:phenylalanyl-tRNA synthetase beta subunit
MHPGRCAAVELDGAVIGHIGELHPKWRQAYELPHAPMLFELDLEAVQRRECRWRSPCRASRPCGVIWPGRSEQVTMTR